MIIMVLGLPGSGKSFFAEQLANRLNAVYINSDRVRNQMQASGKYSYKEKLNVYNEMLRMTLLAIKEANYVIVDATFFRNDLRELFFTLARDCSEPVRVIEVIADEALVKERLQKPRAISQADYAVYKQVKEEFEEISTPHLILTSTNKNIDIMLLKALKYILNERD